MAGVPPFRVGSCDNRSEGIQTFNDSVLMIAGFAGVQNYATVLSLRLLIGIVSLLSS